MDLIYLQISKGLPLYPFFLPDAGRGKGDQGAALLESVREPIVIALSNARRFRELVRVKDLLAEGNRALSADFERMATLEVVADFGLREVMEQVCLVAPSSSPTLLLGETGTGKEVIADAIHMASHRQNSFPVPAKSMSFQKVNFPVEF